MDNTTTINFLVGTETENKLFSINETKIYDYPIKYTFLHMLIENKNTNRIGCETDDTGALIIKRDPKYFQKIMDIYNNPDIKLPELMGYTNKQPNIKKGERITVIDRVCGEIYRKAVTQVPDDVSKYIPRTGYERNHSEYIDSTYNYFDTDLIYENNFTEFLSELDFYGLLPLKNFKPGDMSRIRQDVPILKSRIHKSLIKKTGLDENEITGFVRSIKRMPGCMSGSLILESVLGEDIGSHDLDIYVNEASFDDIIMSSANDTYPKLLVSDDVKAHAKEWWKYNIGAQNMLEYHKLKDDVSEKNTEIINKFRIGALKKYFKHYDIQITDIDEISKFKDDAYFRIKHMKLLIEFKIGNLNIDLIVVDCTPKFFIESRFDFSINKIYYDGYTVQAFVWKDIINRRCVNVCPDDIGNNNNRETQYICSIDRVIKYMNRGFMICISDKPRAFYTDLWADHNDIVKLIDEELPEEELELTKQIPMENIDTEIPMENIDTEDGGL